MAYPTPQDLRERLPDGAPGLTDAQLQGFIDDWKARLLQPGQTEPQQSPIGEQAVVRGATADALEVLYVREGYAEIPVANALRGQANALIARYEELEAGEIEPGEAPVIRFDVAPW